MGKIRIGILTFQDSANYGALLQAYALQKFLETLEYHVEIINYQSPKRKYCRQTLFKRIRSILWKNTFYKIIKDKERQKKTDYFRNTYLNLSKQLYLDKKTLHLCNDLYDALLLEAIRFGTVIILMEIAAITLILCSILKKRLLMHQVLEEHKLVIARR